MAVLNITTAAISPIKDHPILKIWERNQIPINIFNGKCPRSLKPSIAVILKRTDNHVHVVILDGRLNGGPREYNSWARSRADDGSQFFKSLLEEDHVQARIKWFQMGLNSLKSELDFSKIREINFEHVAFNYHYRLYATLQQFALKHRLPFSYFCQVVTKERINSLQPLRPANEPPCSGENSFTPMCNSLIQNEPANSDSDTSATNFTSASSGSSTLYTPIIECHSSPTLSITTEPPSTQELSPSTPKATDVPNVARTPPALQE